MFRVRSATWTFALVCLGVLLLVACAPAAAPTVTPVPDTAVPPTEAPTEEVAVTEAATEEMAATEEVAVTEAATEETVDVMVTEAPTEEAEPTEEAVAEVHSYSDELAALAATDFELPDLGGREVTIALENLYPPFNFINPNTGEALGWDYEVLRELGERMNFEPVFIETSWDGLIVAISNGEFDMAADGITITAERDEIVDFSLGYISLQQYLLVRADEDRFSSVAEFVADPTLLIGVQPGTTNYALAVETVGAENEEARVIGYDPFPIAVQALLAGDVDAVMMDNVASQGYIGANAGLLKNIDEPLTSEQLGFIFPDGSELRDAFNLGLASLAADGSLDALFDEWIAGDISHLTNVEATPEATGEATAES